MFIQIKAIRKRTKPPVWRRAYVPLGITFSQLAYILEILLELPVTDQYEFEFFQEKDCLIERDFPDFKKNSYQFRYRNAVKASIDEWADHLTWFTFRVADGDAVLPQYRVEIENKAELYAKDNTENEKKVPLPYPMLVKESSYKGDRYWTEPKAINQKLKHSCHIMNGKAEYPSFASVCERVERGDGIVICPGLKSLDNIIKESPYDIIKNLWNQIGVLQGRIHKLNSEIERINTSPMEPEKGGSLFEAIQGSKSSQGESLPKTPQSSKSAKGKSFPEAPQGSKSAQTDSGNVPKPEAKTSPYNYKVKQLKSVEEILKAYSKDVLLEIAEGYGCQLHSATKRKMAFELACFIMEPKFMKARLLEFDEEELDTFEAAIEMGTFYPTEDELYNLDGFLNLSYIARFNSGQLQVPEDASIVYTNLCRHGYREFHKKARWLLDCLVTFDHLYGVGNIDLLYKLYCQSKKIKSDRKEFDSILSQIPDEMNVCRKIGNRIMSEDVSENGAYKTLESLQEDVPYYIPSEQEIKDYADHGYPASDPAYQDLYDFFMKDMNQHPQDCEEYCMEAFYTFSIGKMLTDYADFLNTSNVVFDSKRQIEKFTYIAIEVISSTRQCQLRGHTPDEISALYWRGMNGRMAAGPLAAPNSWMNTQTAFPINGITGQMPAPINGITGQMPASISGTTGQMPAPINGITEQMPAPISGTTGQTTSSSSRANMQTGARKIYPNDPCPCGSGKKYKKCCGRNR